MGRVWTVSELRQYGEICNRHGVIVIADEIHADLIMPGFTFQPYAMLGGEFANNGIVCTAPSKTFNLAGMHLSNMIIPNPDLKQAYDAYMFETGVAGGLNPLALVAVQRRRTHAKVAPRLPHRRRRRHRLPGDVGGPPIIRLGRIAEVHEVLARHSVPVRTIIAGTLGRMQPRSQQESRGSRSRRLLEALAVDEL